METDQKRPCGFRIAIDNVHGAAAEQFRQITRLVQLHVSVPEIVLLIRAGVGIVIHGAAAETVEVIVATLQRSEFW